MSVCLSFSASVWFLSVCVQFIIVVQNWRIVTISDSCCSWMQCLSLMFVSVSVSVLTFFGLSENAARNRLAPAYAQRWSRKVNQATLSLSHSPVKAPVPVRTHCTNAWWNRCKTDLNSFPRRKLDETTGTSSYYMDENHSAGSEIHSAGSEIQRPQYGRRSWPGLESSTLEIDVYVQHYALLVVLARNDDDDVYVRLCVYRLTDGRACITACQFTRHRCRTGRLRQSGGTSLLWPCSYSWQLRRSIEAVGWDGPTQLSALALPCQSNDVRPTAEVSCAAPDLPVESNCMCHNAGSGIR